MRVLALDTTTRAGSLALADDGRVLLERAGSAAQSQAERFPNELLAALGEVGWSTADVDLYAVAAGPGSFTGLRIGIATVQGLAFVHGKRVAPLSALEAFATAAGSTLDGPTRVGVWMDAHRREVFSALYDVSASADRIALTEVEGPTSGPPADVLERWTRLGLPSVMCGDGVATYRAALPETIQVSAPPALAAYVARLAFDVAARGGAVSPAAVQPVYVRRPDVELARDRASGAE